MAETLSKELLSGGNANGGWLTITDTATLGETLHTAHATAIDEIWLWAWNESVDGVLLTIEWGAATEPMPIVIPPKEPPMLIIPGLPMTGSDVLSAFAATASVVTVHGYVNRITAS